jgi:thiamine-phosphate diphosphorylase
MKRAIPRFIVILDQATALMSVPEVARAALAGGADMVQVREKNLGQAELKRLARAVVAAAGDPLLMSINTQAELASELGTNLHLSELADFDPARTLLHPSAIAGKSIHGAGEFECSDLDYLLLGNLFDTTSKPGKSGLGAVGFAEVAGLQRLPVLAIGGVRPDNVTVAIESGAYGVAVSSYVNASDNPERAAREIRDQVDRWTS